MSVFCFFAEGRERPQFLRKSVFLSVCFSVREGYNGTIKQRKVIVMKTKKTLCICLTVIAVIAAFTGAVRLWRSDAAYQVDAADARQQIAEAQKLMLAAERLGQTDQTYTALGAPTRMAYDDPMFTDGLYEMVDAYRDENRLYSGVSALAALPEMQGEILPGASYASILETAATVYENKLQTAEDARHHAAVSNGILLGLGLLGVALGVVVLNVTDDEAVSEQEPQPRWHHRPHTPSPHLT